ncbi:helix-turn-helix domain-containing protein [Streptomyces sp. RFCAC02]|uniref:winged helix-turn-helix transcriptional regulator n=1 Tax=Streptomyces sp. RFCAC02 TaxID=2499143 RepID=UPI0010209208|nr:helix-turn-helix domain-containing protein [Streptomyces sp. RFCAC02]
MPRRSYDQYCATARTLDVVGDRWSLLIVRELTARPLRYTDLNADLPGISTDMLATRLKDLERDGVLTRRRLPPPGTASVYALTDRGRALLPVVEALAEWGGPLLGDPRPVDAVRAHWFAVPLRGRLAPLAGEESGVVEVRLPEGVFHVWLGGPERPAYGTGPADAADAVLHADLATLRSLTDGTLGAADALATGRMTVDGEGPVAEALRKHAGRPAPAEAVAGIEPA